MAAHSLQQMPLGGLHDPFRRIPLEEVVCVSCHEPILADDDVIHVNNVGPACSDRCAGKARSR